MSQESVVVLLTHESGHLSQLQFFTRLPYGQMSQGAALSSGFTFDGRTTEWVREPNATNIEAMIAKYPPAFYTIQINGQGPEIGPIASYEIVDPATLPYDRELTARRPYRAAWRKIGGAVTHDMTLAKSMHRTRLRIKRSMAFAALDARWMQATALADVVKLVEVEAERQVLRDLPQDPRIDAAQTAQELAALPMP